MFRFEVHVRITDETGQHIQHMSTAANPSDSFLFSSLFDGDGGVVVGGSGSLSNFCPDVGDPFAGKSTAEALLCCGLVDDFVSRTSVSGPQSGWRMGFPGDWNIFVSSDDSSSSGDSSRRSGERAASEEERSSQWSSEEEHNAVEFDSEESKALWESLSTSSDPYNPFFFSACISTNGSTGKADSGEPELCSANGAGEEPWGPQGPSVLVSRSDSESSWSSCDSSSSTPDEDSERLLELFSSADPYNPMYFTACKGSGAPRPALSPAHNDSFQACAQSSPPAKKPRTSKPALPERHFKHRCHPEPTLVPWTRPGHTETRDSRTGVAHKKVSFSPLVQVHVMRTWPFARQASRKGHWEEVGRDRDRFQRRIRETKQSIGHCFSPAHRKRMRAYLDAQKRHW
uniref:Protein phosphatase 1 regulatory subunit 15A/B C-terminal domain-containing protein n=1 Tax=Mola mola TaxID=94237 RepID=A0A3Q3X7I1_MOLML